MQTCFHTAPTSGGKREAFGLQLWGRVLSGWAWVAHTPWHRRSRYCQEERRAEQSSRRGQEGGETDVQGAEDWCSPAILQHSRISCYRKNFRKCDGFTLPSFPRTRQQTVNTSQGLKVRRFGGPSKKKRHSYEYYMRHDSVYFL